MNKRTSFVVVLFLFLSSIGVAHGVGEPNKIGSGPLDANQQNETRTNDFTGVRGVEYTATLNTSNDTVIVEMYNPTNKTLGEHPLLVVVYDRRYNYTEVTLEPGERWRGQVAFNDVLKVGRENHSLYVYGLGENASASFNYTKPIGTDSPERYPVPEIIDAELVTSTPDGRTGHFLNITVRNEGKQAYLTDAYVHTNQTDGERAPARVPLGQNTTNVYLRLEEDPGDRVMGEVRLVRGSLQNDSGIRDQIYFEGSLEEGVEFRHEPFDPVNPPYEKDSYEFTPNGSEGSRSMDRNILVATGVAFVAVVGVSLVIGLVFRLR